MIFYSKNCRKFTKLAIGMHIPTNARVFFMEKIIRLPKNGL